MDGLKCIAASVAMDDVRPTSKRAPPMRFRPRLAPESLAQGTTPSGAQIWRRLSRPNAGSSAAVARRAASTPTGGAPPATLHGPVTSTAIRLYRADLV
jgi:hypothetical protein